MKWILNIFVLFSGLLYSSCIGCSSSSNGEYDDTTNYSEYDKHEQDISSNQQQDDFQLTGIIETCRHCNGYGMVQNVMYGQPEICKFCRVSTYMLMQQGWTGFDGQYGQVDAVFNTLPADFFNGLDWNAGVGYDDNAGGTSADQIESEIARHEENIAQLEHQLEYIEGSINRTQIQQQIIEEQYEIRRLKAMLNGM